METQLNEQTWLYVIIEKKGGSESLLGQIDSENNISFVPAFYEKKTAEITLYRHYAQKVDDYEVQAIIYEDLKSYCRDQAFFIFLLDEKGTVSERIYP